MNDIEAKFSQRLEEMTRQWVEEELVRRMIHVKEAIQEQVNISLPEIGPTHTGEIER